MFCWETLEDNESWHKELKVSTRPPIRQINIWVQWVRSMEATPSNSQDLKDQTPSAWCTSQRPSVRASMMSEGPAQSHANSSIGTDTRSEEWSILACFSGHSWAGLVVVARPHCPVELGPLEIGKTIAVGGCTKPAALSGCQDPRCHIRTVHCTKMNCVIHH